MTTKDSNGRQELSASEVYEILRDFVKMERRLGASDRSIRIALRNMSGDAMK